ncbi:sulfate/molybdate ABC transporter ATP-binding protein [Aeromicrobium sp. CF3.5]|uniref:sulfate/molybdate ABC transporter ATP-binding protein n=1 Tax=Aeromicrobium sp. CF3.5 TaxID=3373078 RepID=UPI003EE7CA4D
MSLTASARFDDREVDISVEVADGETIAIVGPNGAGKSSLLSALAGTSRPDAGSARLDDDVLYDATTWVPAHRRRTALLAQEPLLFPHLSVLENVAFGPRSTGAPRRAAHEIAHAWLAQVGAEGLADRRPANLSGGQAQRVAVARALAAEPRLLMLDEPMAALDVTVVPAMRQVLRRVLVDRTAIIVTHDVLDALLLADRVVVIEGGRVAEVGPTQDVFTHPRSSFGAELAGLNLVRGTLRGSTVVSEDLVVEGTVRGEMAEGEDAVAVFTPAAVAVHLHRPGGSPRNVIERRIEQIEPLGSQMRIRSGGLSADVTAAAVAELDLAPDRDIVLVVKASEVSIHPA